MAQQLFSINVETAESGLKQLEQTIDELNSLVATCDAAIEGAGQLEKTLTFNEVAIKLFQDLKDFVQRVLPQLSEAVDPLSKAVPAMIALQEDNISHMTAKNMAE